MSRCRLFLLALAWLCQSAQACNAQQQANRTEEITRTDPVGANQLALRAVLIDELVSAPNGPQESIGLVTPAQLNQKAVELEVRDRADKGYYMHVVFACGSAGPCEYIWPAAMLVRNGIDRRKLWPIIRTGDPSSDGALIPACLCGKKDIRSHSVVEFIFIPSITINLAYHIYDESGHLLESGERNDIPGGLPVNIRADKASSSSTRYELVVDHIAADGGSAERYSDVFYFFGSPP